MNQNACISNVCFEHFCDIFINKSYLSIFVLYYCENFLETRQTAFLTSTRQNQCKNGNNRKTWKQRITQSSPYRSHFNMNCFRRVNRDHVEMCWVCLLLFLHSFCELTNKHIVRIHMQIVRSHRRFSFLFSQFRNSHWNERRHRGRFRNKQTKRKIKNWRKRNRRRKIGTLPFRSCTTESYRNCLCRCKNDTYTQWLSVVSGYG